MPKSSAQKSLQSSDSHHQSFGAELSEPQQGLDTSGETLHGAIACIHELTTDARFNVGRSPQFNDLLQTCVTQIQQTLQADRVLIYRVLPDGSGKIIHETVLPHYPALLEMAFPEEVFPQRYQALYATGRVRAIADVHDAACGVTDCLARFVEQFDIKAKLVVPIVQTMMTQATPHNQLWGLLIAHHCHTPRQWVDVELTLMQQLAHQISLALAHAQFLTQIEAVVATHTAELSAVRQTLEHEIIARKQIEATLQQKDEFISVVSHELRTPLTSLHSALKILATGRVGTLSDEGQQILSIADTSTERLLRLLTHVLDLQRIESGTVRLERQPCNAAHLIAQAIAAMQAIAQQHEITLVAQPQPLSVWADADYIVQVLINLLSNAIKFSSPGGTVWLSVEAVSVQPDRPLSRQAPAEVVFRVRDQGQGIPVDQLERIFERFQQVEASHSRKKGGTGLGLTICRTVIEHHQGKIWAESAPGEGCIVSFTLPTSI